MMANSKHLFCSISLALCLVSTLFVSPISCEEVKPRLYVFGSGGLDPGNFLYQNPSSRYGKLPYGMSMEKSQQSAYGMGRRSDGLVFPDFIAQFAGLGIIPPALKAGANMEFGANFAYLGTAVRGPYTRNLRLQLKQFTNVAKNLAQAMGSAQAEKVLKNSVYLFDLGRFDYANSDYNRASQAAKISLVNSVNNEFKSVVTEIYKQGGRKFAFMNVDNVGCTPQLKQMKNRPGAECVEKLLELVRLHNTALPKALANLQTTLPELKYSVFDQYTALENRQKNPGKYGFKEAYVACCGTGQFRGTGCGVNKYAFCPNPSEYLYFEEDGISQAGHYQLARLFWSGGQDVASPYNLKQLFQTNLVQDI